MENTLEKVFINRHLGIKFNSYIDEKLRVWFKAKEVAKILGYRDTTQAIRKNVSIEDKYKGGVQTTGGLQNCVFINESGFYSLVFSSKLETAKFFKRWVFSKVLPSIRKYGYYKIMDSRIKQRVIIDGVKYYKHPVFSKYAASKNGDVINVKTKRIIKMKKSNGYLYFKICDKKLEKPKTYSQHRFVNEVFKGPIPRFFEIDHVNSSKYDNRIKNLQLLTHKQNVEKSKNKAIISTCIKGGKERRFISIKKAAIEVNISLVIFQIFVVKENLVKQQLPKKINKNIHLDTYD